MSATSNKRNPILPCLLETGQVTSWAWHPLFHHQRNIRGRSSRNPGAVISTLLDTKEKVNFSIKTEQQRQKNEYDSRHSGGPHRSPENQFQSINAFAHDKIRPQCWLKEKKRYYLFFKNWMVLIHLQFNPHHPRMLCTKFRSWEDDF